jgi:hypothetical protein
MFPMILNGVDAVEWKWGIERGERQRFPHVRDFRRNFIRQKMSAEARFRSLRILELHNSRRLNRILSNAEHPGSNLSDHVVLVGKQRRWITALARRRECA